MRQRFAEAGFSLVEVLIGLAITIGIGIATLGVVHAFANALASGYASQNGLAAVDQRLADMRAESSTALSVFVPANDVFGSSNASLGGAGHEVDFSSKNGTNARVYWAYYYDAKRGTLQRFDYDDRGNTGVRIAATGAIDPSASYPAIAGVTAFSARGMMASALAQSANPFAAAFSPSASALISDLPVSLNDGPVDRPDNFAGNTIVQVRITAGGTERLVHLAAGAYPTGFTYSGGPAYHAILWRTDNTVKRFFGTISYVYIWADVDVTYDGWKHYEIWCHKIPIYGDPGGLRKGDPREDYGASDPAESAHHIVDVCTNGAGQPGGNGYFAPHPTPPPPDPLASPYPTAEPSSY